MNTTILSQAEQIFAYESGLLNDLETIDLFQSLLDTGLCWKLQGHYGRIAHDLIAGGHITFKK